MALSKAVTGYRFLDKDPVIDAYRYAKEKSGLSEKDIAAGTGLSVSTLVAWDRGKTRRPQHGTIRAAMEECGYKEGWFSDDGDRISVNYAKGTPKAKRISVRKV